MISVRQVTAALTAEREPDRSLSSMPKSSHRAVCETPPARPGSEVVTRFHRIFSEPSGQNARAEAAGSRLAEADERSLPDDISGERPGRQPSPLVHDICVHHLVNRAVASIVCGVVISD